MVGPHDRTAKIADVDLRVGNADVVKVGNLLARVLETPGHTLDHISYVFDNDKALFAADTLFSIARAQPSASALSGSISMALRHKVSAVANAAAKSCAQP